ncbi:MAG: mechanosensitive ion channel [Ruminococcus sp.]|nr:mechanosensitive ion channel [Ruminococcus sp.]
MKSSKSTIIKLIICLAAMAIMIPVGAATKLLSFKELKSINFDASNIWKIIIMVFAVIFVETVVVMLLGLPKLKSHRARSIISIIGSLVRSLCIIVMICWALTILGVNISTIIASLGIMALIVGFSAESLIADIVTGAFIIIENQYNIGDIIEVDGFRGTVTSIGIRTTCLTDTGENVKIVNNSSMKNILNRSDKISRSISDIGIPYETDLEELESHFPALMQDIFSRHSDIMKTPPRYLGVQKLDDSAVVLRFVADVEDKDIFMGVRALNRELFLGFRKLGVEVPFSQLDVHMDNKSSTAPKNKQ